MEGKSQNKQVVGGNERSPPQERFLVSHICNRFYSYKVDELIYKKEKKPIKIEAMFDLASSDFLCVD